MWDRLKARDDLIFALGGAVARLREVLYGDPLSRLGKHDNLALTSSLKVELGIWLSDVGQFAWCGGVHYDHDVMTMEDIVEKIAECSKNLYRCTPEERTKKQLEFHTHLQELREHLDGIPVEVPDTCFPASSPFIAYRVLRSLLADASDRVQVFDPYLDASVFHRYLGDLRPTVELKVVTSRKLMDTPKDRRDVARRDRIVAVSELLAHEMPDRYWFLVVSAMHDRHLRLDDYILHLGGSLKDVGIKDTTMSEVKANDSVVKVLDGYLADADRWYEPGMARHRKWCANCKAARDVKANGDCVTCATPT